MNFRDKVLSDVSLVAYGFLAEADEQTQLIQNRYIQLFRTAHDARQALACAGAEVQVVVCDRQSFSPLSDSVVAPASEESPAREVAPASEESPAREVTPAGEVVPASEVAPAGGVPPASEISPLNLAAALHKDNPLRDIYLEKFEPQGLFVSRAEAAGARGVISREEAQILLGLPVETLFAAAAQADLDGASPEASTLESRPLTSAVPVACELQPISEAPAPPAQPDNLAWLEQVLELEDLDDFAGSLESAVLEKPPAFQPGSASISKPGLELFLINENQSAGEGVTAAFISGRGGVGKSSLAVLTAFSLWKQGLRVVLLDMDLQFGDLGVLCGNEPESRIQRLNLEQLQASRLMLPALGDSMLLLEAPRQPEAAEVLIAFIPRLLVALKQVADIVLINTSCLFDEVTAILASSVDKLVICMDQRATSVSAARQVVDLCFRLQIPSTRLYYLLNRVSRTAPITDLDAKLAMGGVDIVSINEGGADVDELLSLGCPMELLEAQSGLRHSIQALASLLSAKPGRDISMPAQGGTR